VERKEGTAKAGSQLAVEMKSQVPNSQNQIIIKTWLPACLAGGV